MPTVDKNEVDLNQIDENLQNFQRLAGIGTMTAGIAHELINPINIITATCNNMLSQIADGSLTNDELNHYAEMIDHSAWRCARLVRMLRDYSYFNGRDVAPNELNEMVEDSLRLVSYEFERKHNIEIVTDLDPNLEPLLCDKYQIIQVLINLLTNARDSLNNEGGIIRIRTWNIHEEEAQAISVSDTGTGIESAVMPILFESFVTTKPPGEGTGLGLAIATAIIEEHNGQILVVNNDSGGATFTIILPC